MHEYEKRERNKKSFEVQWTGPNALGLEKD